MNNTGIRSIAKHLQNMGRDGDTILAHIMPHEAEMLKRMGGRGSVNPKTGLLEFADDSSSSNQSPSYSGSSGSNYGNYMGGSDIGGYSGSGNTSYTGGGGGGGGSSFTSGGGRDSSSSNQSPSYGGGDGFNSANWGVGGGMLTAGTPTMVSSGGGDFAPMGGNSSSNFMQSLGVPTIVANTMQNVGQSLLNFSDWSTGKYNQMMSGVSPTVGAQTTPGFRSEGALEAQAAPVSDIDPLTGRDYGLEATRRSIGWGETLGKGIASLRDALSAPEETAATAPGFRSEAASGNYDFTPDYTGTLREANALEGQVASQIVDRMWGITPDRQGDFGPAPEGFDVSPESITNQIMTPTGITIQPTTSFDAPGFRSEAALEAAAAPAAGMSLEGLPPGRLGTFDMQTAIQQYRQSLNNIQVPSGYGFNVTAGPYVNDPTKEATYETDEQIAQSIMKNLPLAGLRAAEDGSIVTTDGGIPSGEQMAKVTELAAKEYTVPQSKLPEGAVGQMTLDPRQFVDVRSVPLPPERGAETPVQVAGPPGFRSEAAQNIAQSLETEFENLTKSANLVDVPKQESPLTLNQVMSQYESGFAPPTFTQVPVGSPMAFPETGAAAPTYEGQPEAPAGIVDYTTERLTDPRMQPANLREAISNASLYYGMGYPSLVGMEPTAAGTAGMLANIERESSFNPAAYNPIEDGWGFAQYQRSRLEPFLSAMGLDVSSLPSDKEARAAAIKSALANTDAQQIGYMLNEIATTKAYAPTYKQLTQGTSPGEAATTYMRNFEGALMDPARVAAQAANAERIAKTQFAGTSLSPTVAQSAQTYGLTSPQTTQAAIQTGEIQSLLDAGFDRVLAAIGMSDLPSEGSVDSSLDLLDSAVPPSTSGGRDTKPIFSYPKYPGAEQPVEEEPPPEYTTGMDLTRKTYAPSLPAETYSPAYS